MQLLLVYHLPQLVPFLKYDNNKKNNFPTNAHILQPNFICLRTIHAGVREIFEVKNVVKNMKTVAVTP